MKQFLPYSKCSDDVHSVDRKEPNINYYLTFIVNVPGLTWNAETQQMDFDQSKYSTSNVYCIAACEALKVGATVVVSQGVNKAKVGGFFVILIFI